jgi:putative pyruvate formate lyase activating enzyme
MGEFSDKQQYKIWIDPTGEVWIEDPDQGAVPMARALDPAFAFAPPRLELPPPRLLTTRRVSAPMPWPDDMPGLWALHDRLLAEGPLDGDEASAMAGPSLLDLKRAIARRLFSACVLCEHRCGVDRAADERGFCRVGAASFVAESYVHAAEEREVSPSLCLAMTGCTWHCVYCHTYDIINRVEAGTRLAPEAHAALHARAMAPDVRTLSFVGGNPDQHLPAILDFLADAPAGFDRPVVWNSNMYGSPELYQLLDGVVDVYLGDLRYGNDACASRLSGIDTCWAPVARNWLHVAEQEALLLVRLLVLPGHLACCLQPMIDWVSANLPQARVSLLEQYHPAYLVPKRAADIDRTPSPDEIDEARAMVARAGVNVVE